MPKYITEAQGLHLLALATKCKNTVNGRRLIHAGLLWNLHSTRYCDMRSFMEKPLIHFFTTESCYVHRELCAPMYVPPHHLHMLSLCSFECK